jgi:hypothetical protein
VTRAKAKSETNNQQRKKGENNMYKGETYDKAVEFFGQNAGLFIHRDESEDQARLRTGQELAAAEMTIQEQGWSVTWRDDWEVGSHLQEYGEAYSNGEPNTCEVATLYDSHDEILASLGCIDDATDTDWRVVDAELALEAMAERKIDLVECGTCGRKFPDLYPAARCPFEYDHEEEKKEEESHVVTVGQLADLYAAVIAASKAAHGDSNDTEIEALQDALQQELQVIEDAGLPMNVKYGEDTDD